MRHLTVAQNLASANVAIGSALPLRWLATQQRSRITGTALTRVQSSLRASLAASFSTSTLPADPDASTAPRPATASLETVQDSTGVREATTALKQLQEELAEYRVSAKKVEAALDKTKKRIEAISVELAVPGLDPVKQATLRSEMKHLRSIDASLRSEMVSLRKTDEIMLRMCRDEQERIAARNRVAGNLKC